MAEIPWGQKESDILEFKGRDALKDLFSIGREAVAMLNAQGGEIWVGLREEQGRAVAVEEIEKRELERQRVRDYLVDSIEPRLSSEEVKVEEVPDGDRIVFRLVVSPRQEGRPYALLKQTGRHFLRRFGDRVLLMSGEEIRSAFASKGSDDRDSALREAFEARQQAASRLDRHLWLRIRPIQRLEIDALAPRLKGYLMNPEETDNRRSGWNFVEQEYAPEPRNGMLRTRGRDVRQVEIHENGEIVSWAHLDFLSRTRNGREILWPLALLEYPVSVLRLARRVYPNEADAQSVVIDLALFGVSNLKLAPGSPLARTLFPHEAQPLPEGPDLLLEQPLVVTVAELRDGDRVGFRLLRKVYQAFGYYEDDIPPEFDRKTGRLVIPE